jgi:hypothetical protein
VSASAADQSASSTACSSCPRGRDRCPATAPLYVMSNGPPSGFFAALGAVDPVTRP